MSETACARCGSTLTVGGADSRFCRRCLMEVALEPDAAPAERVPVDDRFTRAWPPWWVLVVAVSFVGYFALLVYCDLWRPEDMGFVPQNSPLGVVITRVAPDSPAALAGIQVDDVLMAADGQAISSVIDWLAIDSHLEFERPIVLQLLSQGRVRQTPLTIRRGAWSYWTTGPGLFLLFTLVAQALMLGLAVIILFKRPWDRTARLGAWLLGSVAVFKILLPARLAAVWSSLPTLVGAVLWLPFVSYLAVAGVLWTFFASFPERAHRSRWFWLWWAPWLVVLAEPVRSEAASVYGAERTTGMVHRGPLLSLVSAVYGIAAIVALVRTYRGLVDRNERRRVQILAIGTIPAVVSGVLLLTYYTVLSDVNLTQSILAGPGTALGTLGLMLFPVSFGYVILRHRLFELSALIRQGVQYALAKHVIALIVPALVVALGLDVVLHRDQTIADVLRARWHLYVPAIALGILAWVQRRRWLNNLDRRFFREQYDAQRILRAVSEDVLRAGNLEIVGQRVVAQIDEALHPSFAALLVRDMDGAGYRSLSAIPPAFPAFPFRADSTLVGLVGVLKRPLEVSGDRRDWVALHLPPDEGQLVEEIGLDLLVPIAAEGGSPEMIIALGVKRSEEPYSSQDIDLLAVIANSLAGLLDRPAPSMPAAEVCLECDTCGRCDDSRQSHCPTDGTPLVQSGLSRVLASRYLLERRLGRGGFGSVYAATDTALGRRVAVKVMRDDLPATADGATRFTREARLAAAFIHPHVVTVHDIGVTERGRAFLVMELLSGRTLRDALKREHRLSHPAALRILRDLCDAMDAAHRQRLIHRDLKPDNIFLTGQDGEGVAKVLDFGIAKLLGDEMLTGERHLTGTGVIIGTAAYMSPEQLQGGRGGVEDDVWALTVIAYEMLTGHHPFVRDDGTLRADRHFETPTDAHGLPGRAVLLFETALSLDRARRPASAGALYRELTESLAL